MKSILFISSLLLSTGAFAAAVGDQASFSGNVTISGSQVIPVTLMMKVLSLSSSSGKFVVETTQTVGGQTTTHSDDRSADEIGSDQVAASYVDSCTSMGGIKETLLLQGSGEVLNTCKITQEASGSVQNINIAAIPFMIAKFVDNNSANNMVTDLTLTSYVRGH